MSQPFNKKAAGSAALMGFSNMVVNILCTKSKNHTLSTSFVKEYFFGENFDRLQYNKRKNTKYYFLITTFVPMGV